MTQLAQYVLLGVVQGATEFLPVSSSAHLSAVEALLSVERPGLILETSLHFGTLLAILLMFRDDIERIVVDFVRGLWLLVRGVRGEQFRKAAPLFGLALALIIGTVPAGVAGVLLHDTVNGLFGENLRFTGICLVITGVILTASGMAPPPRQKEVSAGRALLVGCAQAVAILPGISRSGATIVSGYFVGLDRTLAARFSFLLAVPVMAGAMLLEVAKVLHEGAQSAALSRSDIPPLLGGTIAAAVVGCVCLALLLKVIERGKLHWFAAYCLPAGVLMAVLKLGA